MRSPTNTGELEIAPNSLRHFSALLSATGVPVSAGLAGALMFTQYIPPTVEESRFSSAWIATTVSLYSTTDELIPPADIGYRQMGSPVRAFAHTMLPLPSPL